MKPVVRLGLNKILSLPTFKRYFAFLEIIQFFEMDVVNHEVVGYVCLSVIFADLVPVRT